MPSQEIQWTAVPHGIREESGRTILSCSIVVVPRLQHDTTQRLSLNDYPDWLDWPATLAGAKFGLNVNGANIPSADIKTVSPAPRSDAWKAMFKKTTPVDPFEFKNPTLGKIYTFPIKNVKQTLGEFYDTAMKVGTLSMPMLVSQRPVNSTMKSNVPKVDDPAAPLLGLIAGIADDKFDTAFKARRSRLDGQSKEKWSAYAKKSNDGANPPAPVVRQIAKGQIPIDVTSPEQMLAAPVAGGSKESILHDVSMFHAPRNHPIDTARTKRTPIQKLDVDFHRILGYCRDFPRLQRLLGLVIDVEFDMPPGMPSTGTVMVTVDWTPAMGATSSKKPKTAYRREMPGAGDWYWLPRPQADADSLIKGPFYCLDDPKIFELEQVDVDGQAIKTLEYARGVKHLARKLSDHTHEAREMAPPALRGTGITLVQHGRGLHVAKSLIRATQQYNKNVANTEVTLWAEDLMRGYRIDVWDDVSKKWQSVCRRDETYMFPGQPGDLGTGLSFADEEGTLTAAATKPVAPPGETEHDMYVHEIMNAWDGWSLVAPRIGRYIGTEDELSTAPTSGTSTAAADSGLHLYCETRINVHKGSLPRLRYDRTYRMRARLVDIAGNSAKWNMLKTDDCASPALYYMRWDPIVSPTIALIKDPVEAESLERMVIRNYNGQADDSVDVTTTEESRRQILAPMASQQTCELHGMFDDAPTGPMSGGNSTYELITKREGKVPEIWYKRDTVGNLVRATNAEKSTRKDLISYPVIEQSTAIEPPYLPDPMGRGVTLRGVPGLNVNELMEVSLSGVNMATIDAGTGVATVCFDAFSGWPAIRSILIGMRSGTGKPSWDAGTRTLIIEVPVGHTVSMTFSSNCGEDAAEAQSRLKYHGVWKSVKANAGSASKQTAASRGLAWPITPGRTLVLVHATQKPLKKPRLINAIVSIREPNATNAQIHVKDLYVHGRTTQKIDMHAEWDMWYDDLAEPGPRMRPEKSVVFEQHVEDVTKDSLSTFRMHEFGDTKYRGITYVPTGTTRYREYMPASILADPLNLQRRGEGKLLDILSSKRPESVDLVYVVPTFKWLEDERKLVGNVITSTRKGGGLRVYMRRPWFSSGNGELLGVLLYTSAKFVPPKSETSGKESKKDVSAVKEGGKAAAQFNDAFKAAKPDASFYAELISGAKLDIPDTLHPFVTQWGLDPIWLSTPTPSDNSPRVANFVSPAEVNMNVSIEEVDPAQRFIVVGFQPAYDEQRQLWYCDLEIDPGTSYYPFIRLALCRFQPKSLQWGTKGNDVFVSRVIQSEFCQIPPDRQAMAKIEDDGASVTITIVGHTYRMNASGHQGSEIEVTVEQRDPAWGATAELGWKQISTQRIDRVHAANAWAGLITLPTNASGSEFRLVVKEYEQFYSDPVGPARLTSLGEKGPAGGGEVQLSLDKRIVYADVLPLY